MRLALRLGGLVAFGALAACSTTADKVQATYVSPMKYASYDCENIQYEIARIEREVVQLTGVQNKKAKNDKIYTGVGAVLFAPALIMLADGDVKDELGNAKGEFDALQEAARRKRCFEGFEEVR